MLDPNPYAPPAVTLETARAEAPLPDGVRRFRLDPARYDRFQRMVFGQLLIIVLVIGGVFLPLWVWMGASLMYAGTLAIVTFGWFVVARFFRVRMARKSQLASYELLMSERALRRNLAGWISAEMLRPEVTKIYEVPTGMWLTSESPPHALFVASAIEGYDELHMRLSSWGVIERSGGFSAWTRARKFVRRQGARDATFGTALANDESLGAELALLRSVSTTAGADRPPSRIKALGRIVVLWFALILAFLVLWQFFAGSK